jgi:site-specific DNA recombinase
MSMKHAVYVRVSSEEQVDRNTIQSQLDYHRERCRLDGLEVADEYCDEGISGTVPLAARPAGARLLSDAKDGKFGTVLVYRVDRLARSLKALLEAHTILAAMSITIRSATEPLDTSSPLGMFLFQLLGSMAELEKSTIVERTALGKQRVAREGKWVAGTIPLGYEVEDGHLVPSQHIVDHAECTEAELVRGIFERIAAGSSLIEEATRLDILGVPASTRYSGGKSIKTGQRWRAGRLSFMLHNRTYLGEFTYKSKYGPITHKVPALITLELWDAVHLQLVKNLKKPKGRKRFNLLRGLIKCTCGATFVGTALREGKYYYRCGGQLAGRELDRAKRCRAAQIKATDIEEHALAQCKSILADPDFVIRAGQAIVDEYRERNADIEQQRESLNAQLGANTLARENILTLIRRGRTSLNEADAQLALLVEEASSLRTALDATSSVLDRIEAYTDSVQAMAKFIRELKYDENDPEQKRAIVEQLIQQIDVYTNGHGREKWPSISIKWRVLPPAAVAPFGLRYTAAALIAVTT